MTEPADFSYSLRDVRVVFAEGALSRLGEAIDATLAASRIFLVSTPGRADVITTIRATLGKRVAGEFDRATRHVPTAIVAEAHGLVRAAAADCVVSIGGGSAVGLGKALARETALPLIAVPTTYSGSEMTDIWGITDGDRKITGRDSHVAPRLVVYDPLLTHGLPANVTAPSGMNAIAHAVEALYSSSANPAASLLAADGIRRLGAALPRLVDDPGDGYARQEAFIGAHFCGRALHMTSMGLHHKLCHALGGTLNLPHALTHAVVLPHVTAYNATAAADAMAVVASSLGASHAAQGLWRLNRRLNITQTLSDLGMSEGDVDRVVDEVTATSYPNPAPVTADGVRTILARALEGDAPA